MFLEIFWNDDLFIILDSSITLIFVSVLNPAAAEGVGNAVFGSGA